MNVIDEIKRQIKAELVRNKEERRRIGVVLHSDISLDSYTTMCGRYKTLQEEYNELRKEYNDFIF